MRTNTRTISTRPPKYYYTFLWRPGIEATRQATTVAVLFFTWNYLFFSRVQQDDIMQGSGSLDEGRITCTLVNLATCVPSIISSRGQVQSTDSW